MRPFEKFDYDRLAPNNVEHIIGLAGIMGKRCHWQANAFARQQLQGTQLVARPSDCDGLIDRPDPHHFKLANHGHAIAGNGRPNAWNDGIITLEHLAPVAHFGTMRRNIHVDTQRIDNIDFVPASLGSLHKTLVRIEIGVSGQHQQAHRISFNRFNLASQADRTNKTWPGRQGHVASRPFGQ